MTKVIIEIKRSKNNDKDCDMIVKTQGVEKANDLEKLTTQIVYDNVVKSLKNLNEETC